ncbi:MAG TPA: prepilin-type cleavage/methylation domain-containing protein, partial [Gimesia maris]|nr:prepilin-type cleavage/methylation domain-containing protein [Gimesia maris]
DGAVRFISENIDLGTLQNLTTRAGREVIGEF